MMNRGRKIDLNTLAGVRLFTVIYIFGVVIGYLCGYRLGQVDERQDCIDATCLNSSYFEEGTITNFYINIDPESGE